MNRACDYYDVCDTVRCNYDDGYHRIAASRLMAGLLSGRTPCFSQTQMFDGAFALRAAAETKEGMYFCALVKSGDIRVPLFNSNSLLEGFIKALQKPFFEFSAWPEIMSGEIDREYFIENLRRRRVLTSAPSNDLSRAIPLDRRMQALFDLDEAIARGPKIMGRPAETPLSGWLREFQRKNDDRGTREQIERLLKAEQRDSRAALYGELRNVESEVLREDLRGMIDASYHLAVSESLGAKPIELTTERPRLVQPLSEVVGPKAEILQVAEIDDTYSALSPLGWEAMAEFLEDLRKYPPNHFQQIAFAEKFLERVPFEKCEMICMKLKPASEILFSGLTAAITVGGNLINKQSAEVTLVTSVAATLLGYMSGGGKILDWGTAYFGKKARRRIAGVLRRDCEKALGKGNNG